MGMVVHVYDPSTEKAVNTSLGYTVRTCFKITKKPLYVCFCVCICVYVWGYMCVCVFMFMCMYVHVCVCIVCVCTYIRTYMQVRQDHLTL